jgi:hypothetical protein
VPLLLQRNCKLECRLTTRKQGWKWMPLLITFSVRAPK